MSHEDQSQSSDRKAFKDYFDQSAVQALSTQITSAWRKFPTRAFVQAASHGLTELEFSQRVSRLAECLRVSLPDDIPAALKILQNSLPEPFSNCDSVADGWLQWPIGQFIAEYGVDHFDPSMSVMIELTQRFSSEFAVRPFVIRYPDQTIERLTDLINHPSAHVRRWCSEAVRPRLPWGSVIRSLVDDPSPILPILDALHDDEELYVRRSVANNLNDIAKDHPSVVVSRCLQYQTKDARHTNWVIRHALRTLIKDGNQAALAALGYNAPRKISAELHRTPAAITVGDSIELVSVLKNESNHSQQLAVDFELTFVRKNGMSSAKVFKWKSLTLSAGEQIAITKRHPMKATTVRRLYSGEHKIRLMVNGKALASAQFDLDAPERPES